MFMRERRRRDPFRQHSAAARILSSHSSPNPNEGSHESGGEGGEGEVDVFAPVVANGETAEASHPGQRPLDLPAVPSEPAAVLDATPGDARDDAATATLGTAEARVVAIIGVQLAGTSTWPAAGLA